MSATFLLIRHGDPELPDEKVFYGRTDLPLSPTGIARARSIRGLLDGMDPGKIVSSPLSRCLKTAEAVGLPPAHRMKIIKNLSEIDMGEWEMAPFARVSSDDPQAFRNRWEKIETFRPPKGESFQDLAERVIPTMRALSEEGGTTAIFGHAGVFKVILWKEMGISLKSLFSIRQDYCGIHVLKYGATVELVRSNWSPIESWLP